MSQADWNRRQWLQYSAALTATAAWTAPAILSRPGVAAENPLAEGRAKREAKVAFGLVTYQWGNDWALPELLANCAKTGARGVELRTTHAHGVEPSLNEQQQFQIIFYNDDPLIYNPTGAAPKMLQATSPTTPATRWQ